jgi:hypothetical protein
LVVWLSGQVDYSLAEEVLREVGELRLSDTSIWRRAKRWGEKIKALEAVRIAGAMGVPQQEGVVRGESKTAQRIGVAMDGMMVHVREEGYKELKVGCVFELEVPPGVQDTAGRAEERVRATHNSYTAVLGGPGQFGQALWAEASRRQLPRAVDSIVLGDGASWIWKLAEEHFPYSRQAVDWYHAQEHLYHVAHLTFGEGTAAAIRWAKGMETPLYQGQVWQLTGVIKRLAKQHPQVAQELHREAEYFTHNKRRMQYMELREDGFPIGSGMVESGCKQFRARFTGPGMRWSRAGVERLSPIRAAILSKRFHEVWTAAYNSPQN